jgi:hypothetical protein
LYFFSQSFVLIIDVSYEAKMVVLERTLLLKFVPLLMENVESLRHGELLQKVSDEIINDDFELFWHNKIMKGLEGKGLILL